MRSKIYTWVFPSFNCSRSHVLLGAHFLKLYPEHKPPLQDQLNHSWQQGPGPPPGSSSLSYLWCKTTESAVVKGTHRTRLQESVPTGLSSGPGDAASCHQAGELADGGLGCSRVIFRPLPA